MNKSFLPEVLVIDTCVLISNVLRRLLLRLAEQACFQPAWSEVIGDEWRRNAARLWGVPELDIQMQWQELQHNFPLADQGELASFKVGLSRSDPKDWHVIAAARAAKSHFVGATAGIVTRNMKDFNRTELRGYGLTLFDPDELLVCCWRQYPDVAAAAFDEIPAFALAPGRELEPLGVILKRERLFRLNRLYSCAP
ncbi:PIN domain-containing protein [Alcaligenaceae bacterium]|nr:PIN domain-containing protein [Alcaligenaceae bacterium]